MKSPDPYILLDDQLTHKQRYYTGLVDIITANQPSDIDKAFEQLTEYHQQGYYLAGYLSYELGYIFEPKLAPLLTHDRLTPLMHFGIFRTVSDTPPTQYLYSANSPQIKLSPLWNETEYRQRFHKVQEYIKAGDVYQINLTFPMSAQYEGPAHTLYAAFRHRQKGRYGGIVSLEGTPDIISLSPELFFRKEGLDMSMRPMKGTRPRSMNDVIDETLKQEMRGDAKSQAENLMIVDLLRNDMSKISKPGTVKVPELFSMETYPTLHQMTSRVMSKLKPGINLETIFKSLFPCGSVTGAPKIRAMEIIHELETQSRGAYCGSLGYIDPNGDACFNVGIRTITLSNNRLIYNVGSGLVLDSDAADEYKECLLKADVLAAEPAYIIETFRWDPKDGFIRGKAHKTRMKTAAKALAYPFKNALYEEALKPARDKTQAQHLRLTLGPEGEFSLTSKNYTDINSAKIIISGHKLSSAVQGSEYKISRRNFYDGERERLNALTGADEVIFLNDKGHVCEGSFTSVFIQREGKLLTPPLNAGLLPGILRAELLQTRQAKEANMTASDLKTAEKIFIGNSLRGLIPATFID